MDHYSSKLVWPQALQFRRRCRHLFRQPLPHLRHPTMLLVSTRLTHVQDMRIQKS